MPRFTGSGIDRVGRLEPSEMSVEKTLGRWMATTSVSLALVALLVTTGMVAGVAAAHAEPREVRVSYQFGLGFLPVVVVLQQGLIEKHARDAGLGDVKVSGLQLSGAAITNDSLISNSIDVASGGIGGLLQLWDKTKGNVKGIVAVNDMSYLLNTNDPSIQSLKDYVGKKDHKIALPAVKVGAHAIVLEMVAEKELGIGKQYELDTLTMSLPHPDAYAAVVGENSAIRSHLGSLPFSYLELKHKGVHTVFSSYDKLGSPINNTLLYATSAWAEKNPKLLKAVFDAFVEAEAWITAHPDDAARLFKTATKSKFELADLESMIRNKRLTGYAPEPKNTYMFAEFLHKIGRLQTMPAGWKDYFFPIAHVLDGS
jgi:NitT/TauT family transport system substrate-binding protein